MHAKPCVSHNTRTCMQLPKASTGTHTPHAHIQHHSCCQQCCSCEMQLVNQHAIACTHTVSSNRLSVVLGQMPDSMHTVSCTQTAASARRQNNKRLHLGLHSVRVAQCQDSRSHTSTDACDVHARVQKDMPAALRCGNQPPATWQAGSAEAGLPTNRQTSGTPAGGAPGSVKHTASTRSTMPNHASSVGHSPTSAPAPTSMQSHATAERQLCVCGSAWQQRPQVQARAMRTHARPATGHERLKNPKQ